MLEISPFLSKNLLYNIIYAYNILHLSRCLFVNKRLNQSDPNLLCSELQNVKEGKDFKRRY